MKANQRLLCYLIELTSHKQLSWFIGLFTKTRVSRWLIPWYVKTYAIRTQDLAQPLYTYRSLNEFFVRRLKDGLRPIDQGASALVSPVDATVTGIGHIHDHLTIFVKGQNYRLEELLQHSPVNPKYKQGFFLVLYLSPADYHRIHTPVSGSIMDKNHLPGKNYPVNNFGLRNMRKVLSRNERLITSMQHRYGLITIVKVGAMNVSSIKYSDPFQQHFTRGDELAYFEFGSTVVLLMENSHFDFRKGLGLGSKVLVGEAIGYWEKKDGD